MDSDTRYGTFASIVQNQLPETAAIACQLRDLIANLFSDVIETPRPAEQHADYSLEIGKRNQAFAYICPVKNYVRLGFYYGGSLPDPANLLIGERKRLRHIKIYTPAEVEQEEIKQVLRAAYAERAEALT